MCTKNKRVVISGLTGFIGRYVGKEFIDHGWEVYGIVRTASSNRKKVFDHPNMHIVEADIRNIKDIVPQIGKADVFLHLAWGGGK